MCLFVKAAFNSLLLLHVKAMVIRQRAKALLAFNSLLLLQKTNGTIKARILTLAKIFQFFIVITEVRIIWYDDEGERRLSILYCYYTR